MSKLTIVAAAALALAACQSKDRSTESPGATPSPGDSQYGSQGSNPSAGGDLAIVTGTVAGVSGDSVKIKTSTGDTFDLEVSEDSPVFVNGQPIQGNEVREQVHEGNSVRASYSADGADRNLKRIDVVPSSGGNKSSYGSGSGQEPEGKSPYGSDSGTHQESDTPAPH